MLKTLRQIVEPYITPEIGRLALSEVERTHASGFHRQRARDIVTNRSWSHTRFRFL
ncbi:MAG: hypothetical protein OXL68_12475 [Paracoccaceae bacterium]|nr:hypothetical protein [Paracoccaceae bacterium]